MSEKPYGHRHLTEKWLENEKIKVLVKCLFLLIWIEHLTSVRCLLVRWDDTSFYRCDSDSRIQELSLFMYLSSRKEQASILCP